MSLHSAQLKLQGNWDCHRGNIRVLSRVRDMCLSDVRLLSDRQPRRIRVEHRSGCYPSIWLHDEDPNMAWIIVSTEPHAWCQLAYQFGHELGHALCNSWDSMSLPHPPCQWLEESLVEAFAIRGLGHLAASWERDPPFKGDAPFAAFIQQYREDLIAGYNQLTAHEDIGAWFHEHQMRLARGGGESDAEGPMTISILRELEANNSCVEDLGALNRWSERSGVPINDYLTLWETSCAEIGASGVLPRRLRRLLDIT